MTRTSLMRNFGGALPLVIVLALVRAGPVFASHWIEVGSNGSPDNKVKVNTDSLRRVGQFTFVDIMTVYPAPLVNSHDIELDRYVQRTAIDCLKRTFVAVKTTGYLRGKPVGTSRELKDWRLFTVPMPNDPASNRIYQVVCGPPPPKAG
ncbi:MAG TPA: surface-adhesin E family protein [Steroidobacteraceae bacterium]|nr:surface-adhesin E family protein [Steroidobacteraceae bacterium]